MHVHQTEVSQATSLGERIKTLRNQKGLSLAQLANEAGISRSYLWQLETDQSRPSIDVFDRLAEALQVSRDELEPASTSEQNAFGTLRESVTGVEQPTRAEEASQLPQSLLLRFLEARGSASMKAVRYAELGYPWVDYMVAVDAVDQVFRSPEPADECAEFILHATRAEKDRRLDEAVRAYRRARARAKDADVVAFIDLNLASLFEKMYRYEPALEHFFRALGRLERRVSLDDAALMQTAVGYLSYRNGRYQTATKYFKEALETWAKVVADEPVLPETRHLAARRGLGSIHERLGEFGQAEEHLEEAISKAQKEGEHPELAWATARLGFFHIRSGKWIEAEREMDQAEEIIKRLFPIVQGRRGLETLQEIILNNRGLLCARQGDYAAALQYSEDALTLAMQQLNDQRGEAFCHFFIALTHAEEGALDPALAHLLRAEKDFKTMGINYHLPEIRSLLAEILCCHQNLKLAALPPLEEALSIVRNKETGSRYQEALVLRVSGLVHSTDDEQCRADYDRAQDDVQTSISILEEIGDPYELARAYYSYGLVLAKQGQVDAANKRFAEARRVADEVGAKGIATKAKEEAERLSV